MALVIPNTLSNGINADGAKLQQNFAAIQTDSNTNVIRSDGTVAMAQPLGLVAPVASGDAARKQDVDAAVPVGTVVMFAGAAVPSVSYQFCRGQAISRSTYASLFTAIGTAYGTGDGSTTFNVPNFQATYPVGFNSGTNPPSGLSGVWAVGLGERAGSKDSIVVSHTHTMGNHVHGMDHFHNFSGATGIENAQHAHTMRGSVSAGTGGGSINGLISDPTFGQGVFATTDPENANHAHSFSGNTVYASQTSAGWVNTQGPSTNTTDATGSGASNANLPPGQSINFIIKVA